MSRVPRIPYATPEEEGLEATGRAPYAVTTRSRIADAAREEALQQQLEEAPTPDEQEQILGALDALQAEQEEDAEASEEYRREQERIDRYERAMEEQADARRDERDSR